MQVISSKENEIIKKIKKLKDKKYRDLENKFIVEGIKIIREAIVEKANIDKIIVCEECINNGNINKELLYEIAKFNCIYVTEKVFQTLTDVVTHQGILAIIEKQSSVTEIDYKEDIIVVLDGIQDPGNLGTILRTVDSVGLKQIILSEDTTDSYNPKVVRSTMGAIFRLNIIETKNLKEVLKEMKKHKFEVVSTSLETNDNIYDIDYNRKVLVIGNEANGVSKEILDLSNRKIKIPMIGKTESLNVSVATSIVLYEYVRQKINKN